MTERVQLPKDKHLAEMVIQADAEKQARDMGSIGRYLGSKENAAVYFAGVLVILSLLAAAAVAVFDATLRPDALKGILAIGTTALGFFLATGVKNH